MPHTTGPEGAAEPPLAADVPSTAAEGPSTVADAPSSAGSRPGAEPPASAAPSPAELPPGTRSLAAGGEDQPVPPAVAACALVVVLVLGVAAAASPQALGVALVACVAVVAWGWAGTLGLPTPRGTVGVIVVGGLALVLSVGARTDEPGLGWVPVALSLAMIAAFTHQLLRRDGRPRVVESVSSVVLALALVACGALLVPMSHTADGLALVLAALAAAAASAVTDLLGRIDGARTWLTVAALLAGGGAAALVALWLDRPVAVWLLVGVAAGALSHTLRRVLRPLPTLVHPRPQLVTAVVSVLVVGLVPFLVALAFVPGALPG